MDVSLKGGRWVPVVWLHAYFDTYLMGGSAISSYRKVQGNERGREQMRKGEKLKREREREGGMVYEAMTIALGKTFFAASSSHHNF